MQEAAAIRANELTSSFSHTRPDGRSCFTVLDECHVTRSRAGENIAWATAGFYTPEEIVQGWMDSAGHRANILNGLYTHMGVGYAIAGGKEYFVQLFIG